MFDSIRGRLSDVYGWTMIAVGSILQILGGGLYFLRLLGFLFTFEPGPGS